VPIGKGGQLVEAAEDGYRETMHNTFRYTITMQHSSHEKKLTKIIIRHMISHIHKHRQIHQRAGITPNQENTLIETSQF